MAGVAKLSTVSTLDATKFTAGIRQMQVSMKPLQAAVAGAFGGIGLSIGRVVTGALAAVPKALGRATLAGLQLGDSLADASRMTGIAASTLATYHRAARLAGLGASEFDEMIGRLNVNVAEAIQGDKKFAALLTKAGVDLAKIANLSPDETFLAMADAIAKADNQFDRSFLARQAFGRGGIKMLPSLVGGAAGFTSLAASTARLGAAPSSADVLSIERANDALQDLGTAVDGLKLQLAKEFAPTLTTAAQGLLRWLETNQVGGAVGSASNTLGKAAVGAYAANSAMQNPISRLYAGAVNAGLGMLSAPPRSEAALPHDPIIPWRSEAHMKRGLEMNASAQANAARRQSAAAKQRRWRAGMPLPLPTTDMPNPKPWLWEAEEQRNAAAARMASPSVRAAPSSPAPSTDDDMMSRIIREAGQIGPFPASSEQSAIFGRMLEELKAINRREDSRERERKSKPGGLSR